MEILFQDILSFITKLKANKKIIFIDPIVLTKKIFYRSYKIEKKNLVLIPTNIYEKSKNFNSLISILKVLEDEK